MMTDHSDKKYLTQIPANHCWSVVAICKGKFSVLFFKKEERKKVNPKVIPKAPESGETPDLAFVFSSAL